jgi:hypothetical protein
MPAISSVMALGSCNSIQKGLTKTVNKKSKMKITAQRTSELWTLGSISALEDFRVECRLRLEHGLPCGG